MIITDKPYISELLKNTAKQNEFEIYDASLSPDIKGITLEEAISSLRGNPSQMIYCNSENSIDIINKHFAFTGLPEKINLFKDKIKFRKLISSIYPDFYFKEVKTNEMKFLNPDEIRFPVVIKPAVGFLSFGVYKIKNKSEWENTVTNIESDTEKYKNIFPETVVDTSEFIIEEMIKGEEYAVDVYFNENTEPVILNIFKHPFFNEKDVSDRLYYTSAEIISEYLDKFRELFSEISRKADLKNFPAHIELRVNGNDIIPIEVNPMRFAGWCITDISYFARGINVYEYCLKGLKPDWDKILKCKDGIYYYFVVAALPDNIKNDTVKSVDYEKFNRLMKNPLEVRKIDCKTNPLFAIAFAQTRDYGEIESMLGADFSEFIEVEE